MDSHHSWAKDTFILPCTVQDNGTRQSDTVWEQHIRVAWSEEAVLGVLYLGVAM
jgi:hypothetical protein